MSSAFDFTIFHPQARLANSIQALWSASVSAHCDQRVTRWLQCDAASGIIFNFGTAICLDGTWLGKGYHISPVSKQAQSLVLLPGSSLCGIRFHPGNAIGIADSRQNRFTDLNGVASDFSVIYKLLADNTGHRARISALYRWLCRYATSTERLPTQLRRALHCLRDSHEFGQLNDTIPISQRQLERQFQKWVGMTAKEFQRILRVKKSFNDIKVNPNTSLVDLAHKSGFSDQSHMTREFKTIARITPKKLSHFVQRRRTCN